MQIKYLTGESGYATLTVYKNYIPSCYDVKPTKDFTTIICDRETANEIWCKIDYIIKFLKLLGNDDSCYWFEDSDNDDIAIVIKGNYIENILYML